MNITKIAKLAGVSNAAVSRYFNKGYLSEEKKEAIRAVVEQYDYHPLAQAQTLRTKKSRLIGVIAPKMVSDSIGDMVEGILSVLNAENYQMILAITQGQLQQEIEYLKTFGKNQVDGILLMGSVFTSEHEKILEELKIPTVILAQHVPGHGCVYFDDYHALYDMTKHVIAAGCRRPVFMSAFHEDLATGRQRWKGYIDALNACGLEAYGKRYEVADFTTRSGYEKMEVLYKKYPDLDAVICASDEMATGAVQYLKNQGIRVPEEVLISGVGDLEMAKVVNPSLMTIHYSFVHCGESGARLLMKYIKKPDKAAIEEIMLGYTLIRD